jgi:hypothetical protein
MGRPLKIAKAQTVNTITATSAVTNIVTVSNTANFTVGMSLVTAATVGGIFAGTTYWVLSIPGPTTMTLSDTPLNANWTSTPVTLTSTVGQSVSFSVNLVDTGFNNPDGITNTYGVVGGNTAIVGPQVACSVAISQSATGIITSDSTSNDIYGGGTDFTTTVVVGSAIQAADGTDLGYVASIGGQTVTSVTATTVTTDIITAVSTAGLVLDQPIVFDAAIGGLVTGTVYYVQAINNATDFTVATQPAGTAFKLTTAAAAVNATQDVLTLGSVALATGISNGWSFATGEAGFIVRQKGRSKFLVTGSTSGLTGICYTADLPSFELTVGTMSIGATLASAAYIFVERLSDHIADGFGGLTATPYYVTFNAAEAADSNPAQPYEIIQIDSQ